ncbi:nucleoside-diphosphate kinase [Metallosphaera hakonensis]|uniref:Nucleoside diphosphate kinase n=1 Tax=Metallosphaera hakonensis JCM 8857 = DSM 7519 TaxID=1293036 RepID=A0A2U9ITZ8_9CREN|nr:nucleoside-diphosphate kinase [Metallosphaera hakonensis]AWR99494.1 nucleoside-diphosphate kinase [Metallosphaera hakonensis JCM 8857 = DSM 7519]
MAIQRTFVMIKPDGVKRKLIGEIVGRIERKGLRIVAMKMVKIDKTIANKLYEEHLGKSFFNELVEYITSGPVLCMVIEGDEAVKVMRTLIGATDPKDALPGTIRGDLALSKGENVIHASDAEEKAKREMALFFSTNEIIE